MERQRIVPVRGEPGAEAGPGTGEARQSPGPPGGATVDLTAGEVRALFNILSFVASGGATAERPEREMAARIRARLERALGGLPAPPRCRRRPAPRAGQFRQNASNCFHAVPETGQRLPGDHEIRPERCRLAVAVIPVRSYSAHRLSPVASRTCSTRPATAS